MKKRNRYIISSASNLAVKGDAGKEGPSNKRHPKPDGDDMNKNIQPKVGMRLEICDSDNIWSTAKIVKIQTSKNKNKSGNKKQRIKSSSFASSISSQNIVLRYEGWGSEWDETLTFKNNPRLAECGSYTKQLKCMVDLFPRRDKKSSLWPCIVNVRNPSPLVSLEDYALAEEFLRQEPKIFIQPYGINKKYLPHHVLKALMQGGIWANVARIRMWRHDISSLEGRTVNSFTLAHELAMNDEHITETLPYAAFDKGSLINARHRVTPDGYEEAEAEQANQDNEASSITTNESMQSNNSSRLISASNSVDNQLVYEPPAVLPSAVKVNTSIYPRSNIRKSLKTGKWIASYFKNGNEIILGSFSTQTQANKAIKAVMAYHKEDEEHSSVAIKIEMAQSKDMKHLALGTISSLGSQQEDKSSQKQHTKHKGYENEKFRARFEELKKERELQSYEERERKSKHNKKMTLRPVL